MGHAIQQATQDDIVAAFRDARAKDFEALRKNVLEPLECWQRVSAVVQRDRTSEADLQSAGRALPQALRRIRERARELDAIDSYVAVERRSRATGGATQAPRAKGSDDEIHN